MTSPGPAGLDSARGASPSWDTRGRPGRAAGWVAAAVVAALPGLVSTVLRIFPPADDATVMLAAFIPYGLIGYVIAALLLVIALIRARRRRGVAVVLVLVLLLTGLHLAWLAPRFVPDARPAGDATVSVLELNLDDGLADPDQVMAQAARADLVVLVESTPAALRALANRGISKRFPYGLGGLAGASTNTTVYSRFPLSDSGSAGRTSSQQWQTTVAVPDLGEVRLIAVHPCNPYCGGNLWAAEHRIIRDIVRQNLYRPLIVVGDFNAVDDHGPMQHLRRDGLRDAADLTGAGWRPTWPADQGIPPLLGIDHLLVDARLTTTSFTTFRVDGTDHLGTLTTVAGVRSAGAGWWPGPWPASAWTEEAHRSPLATALTEVLPYERQRDPGVGGGGQMTLSSRYPITATGP